MIIVDDLPALRTQVRQWRQAGERVAFVPTMGNLHDGHLELVRVAHQHADRVVVSIFVNPMQFGENEDFDAYPHTPEEDRIKLEGENTDLLFSPSVEVMYPRPQSKQTRVEVPGISNMLCGAARPGHFVGVATVVCKLFNMVQPDVAVFGEKDFQQLLVIRRMTEDLCMPVQVIGVPTVREPDGLARSSRNGYLTAEERQIAPALYHTLNAAAMRIRAGDTNFGQIQAESIDMLAEAGFKPDYFQIRQADDLKPAIPSDPNWVILAAAYLGKARLIDNLTV